MGKNWTDRYLSKTSVSFSRYYTDLDLYGQMTDKQNNSTGIHRSIMDDEVQEIGFKLGNTLLLNNNTIDIGVEVANTQLSLFYHLNDKIFISPVQTGQYVECHNLNSALNS